MSADIEMWNGRLSKVIISDQSYPELFDELLKVSPRARSERLKSLAMFGLMYLRQSHAGEAVKQLAAVDVIDDPRKSSEKDVKAEKLDKAKKEIRGRLLKALPSV